MARRSAVLAALLPAVLAHSPACPCIDPWEGVAVDAACAADPANPRAAEGMSATGEATCVAADYGGGGCRAWDEGNPQCLNEPKPEWCFNSWCYVNASDCLRP